MSEKKKLIYEMLAMQKEFIAKEKSAGIDLTEYYNSTGNDDLGSYQKTYSEMANQLVDLAHAEKGSRR